MNTSFVFFQVTRAIKSVGSGSAVLSYCSDSMANLVNNQYAKVAGDGEALLPLWDEQGQADADTAGGVTYYD